MKDSNVYLHSACTDMRYNEPQSDTILCLKAHDNWEWHQATEGKPLDQSESGFRNNVTN